MMDVQGPMFDDLSFWIQTGACTGPVNMAVDELLLKKGRAIPILRVYQWDGDWATMGYFSNLVDAQKALPGVSFVRRWTGGGVVDHRLGHTYSLIIPRSHSVFSLTSIMRYQVIHRCLQSALQECNVECRITENEQNEGEANCFLHPVEYDLVNSFGTKMAGAGQRRSREGVLYQGAVQTDVDWRDFANALPQAFATKFSVVDFSNMLGEAKQLAVDKYPVL